MRILLIITCLANIAFAFGTLPWMPERVAVRLASDGSPIAFVGCPIVSAMWSSIAVITMTVAFLVASKFSSTLFADGAPFMPNRNYWLSEENCPKMVLHIRSFCYSGGFATMLFFFVAQLVFFQANMGAPPMANLVVLFLGISAIPIFIVVAMIRLYISFRLPKTEPQS